MSNVLVGLSIFQWAIIVICCAVYLAIILSLAWESHSKYGTGYWWVGACFAGLVAAYFNYKYYVAESISKPGEYPLWLMIIINVFLGFIGLWAYIIYHTIFLSKSKAVRSGSRLERKVFAEDQAATGSGRFREHLRGWEGDVRLDMLIVEKKFDEAEDYLVGEIMKASNDRETQKARHYELYRSIIQKERLIAENSKDDDQPKSITSKKVDIKRTEEIKQDDLPEGWSVPD